MEDITTIQLRKATRDRLLEVGRKKETYDELINRLIDFYVAQARGRMHGAAGIDFF